MAYVPDPEDGAAPLNNVDASTAAAEFRALKTYLQGLINTGLALAGTLSVAGVTTLGEVTVGTVNSSDTDQTIANAGTYDILNVGTNTVYLISAVTRTAGQDVSLIAIVSCTAGPTVRIHNLFASAGLALSNPSTVICRITNTTGVSQDLMISTLRIYN